MTDPPREAFAFTVRASVPGIPPWPTRSRLWRDRHRPGEPRRWWAGYPAEVREKYEAPERAEAQAARVRQASHLIAVDLDAARCRFGARTMSLAGTIESQHLEAAVGAVLGVVRWSLRTVYDVDQVEYPGGPYRPLNVTSLSIRPTQRSASRRSAAE